MEGILDKINVSSRQSVDFILNEKKGNNNNLFFKLNLTEIDYYC